MNKMEKDIIGTATVLIGEGEKVGIDPDHLVKRMIEEAKKFHEEMEAEMENKIKEVNHDKN